MDVKKINENISVAPQIMPDDMTAAAAQGFRTIVNNRPDGEGGAGQPASVVVEAAAKAAGLNYIYLPVVSGQITESNISDFQKALAGAEKPVLAYCRTGTRCTNLWALAVAPDMAAADIITQAADAGYDLRGLTPVLQQRGAK
jgi:uncharacterized protein (TIGR01244 family)